MKNRLKLALEMKRNNKNLDFINYFKLNRAIMYIALFSLVINLAHSQINEVEDRYLWISRDSMINKNSIDSALHFASQSGFNKVFLQINYILHFYNF